MPAYIMFQKIIFIICLAGGAVHLQIAILWMLFLKNLHKIVFIYVGFYGNVNWVVVFWLDLENMSLFIVRISRREGKRFRWYSPVRCMDQLAEGLRSGKSFACRRVLFERLFSNYLFVHSLISFPLNCRGASPFLSWYKKGPKKIKSEKSFSAAGHTPSPLFWRAFAHSLTGNYLSKLICDCIGDNSRRLYVQENYSPAVGSSFRHSAKTY